MYTDEELKDLSIRVLHKLDQKFGFKEAEVYLQSLSHMMGGTEYRTPKVFQSINREGCAIRFFKDGRLYFACFPLKSVLSDIDKINTIVSFPIDSPKFEFPEIKISQDEIDNIYDKRIAAMNEEEIYSLSYSLNDLEDKMKDIILDGSIRFSLERKIIANSTQSIAFEKSTWNDINLRALYRGFDLISSSEKHLTSRQILSSVSSIVEDLVQEAIQRSTMDENTIDTDVPVIFSPMALSQIFSFTIIPHLKLGHAGKLAEQDFSSDFNLIDDGTVPGLPNSTAFDDEGISQSRTIIIRNGSFQTALNNCQNEVEPVERTGNSFRVKMFEVFPRNFQAYPEIYPSNLIIGEGETSLEQMYDDTKECILINSTQGYMTADHHSGTFKVSANDAYRIENGSISGALPTFDVIGNMFEVLSEEPLFLKDRKVVRPINTPYSVLAPYLSTKRVELFP
ncbi:MAG: metallopeptidase TldD-related protein [Candidatus Heimdallarchaeaceae archaeon]